jgi:hypothetical protein
VALLVIGHGALAAPFFGGDLRAAGFSGTGGGLAMTVVLRKDPLDIAQVLSAALGFDARIAALIDKEAQKLLAG